ncbi:DUF4291 domain-containing protein [Neolewinella lacunae]|uniref:DUF4291 domain-containing protein n=1 Tax=Neolewinella lacunae TaxID=1517758 RepID=A0A923PLN2_9BACT|nr:DUF4291 domain-containing protein [Neolewinella lacunae]MBC6993483.1 DUF4291 domain-containing protein [Neolewinella lacunae]MDN3636241.1 DUF4291 domain-containing protein [Neolewinella lacunae]
MQFTTIPYPQYLESVPQTGRHILGHQRAGQILVYQAYNHAIADFAIKNQYLGGSAYSYSRMSWIKPNFLWMMYRCGWCAKENQERVLGLWMNTADFDLILSQSVFSSFKEDVYETTELWKEELTRLPVRLQWDPDHDIFGKKQERKAIQLGIKGDLLQQFAKEMILEVIDLTAFAKEQQKNIATGHIRSVQVPEEWVYLPQSDQIKRQIGLDV